MELALPDEPADAVDLVVVPELGGGGAEPRLPGRVSLSRPAVVRLTADEVDDEVGERGRFLRASGGDFYLVTLVCSFRPGPNVTGYPFLTAGLGLDLVSPDPHEPPIAWSMTPKLAVAPSRSGTGVKLSLGVNLKFVEPKLEMERGAGEPVEEPYLRGLGEQQSDPEWRFHRTSGHPLVGDERLTLIVRAAAGAPARARVLLAATVRGTRLGLFRYRAELPPTHRDIDLPAQATTLGPGIR